MSRAWPGPMSEETIYKLSEIKQGYHHSLLQNSQQTGARSRITVSGTELVRLDFLRDCVPDHQPYIAA